MEARFPNFKNVTRTATGDRLIQGVDIEVFRTLLHYVYTGDFPEVRSTVPQTFCNSCCL